jgi:hypothetical protein
LLQSLAEPLLVIYSRMAEYLFPIHFEPAYYIRNKKLFAYGKK